MVGGQGQFQVMPNFSFVLFAAMTILVSFTLPGLIAKRMEEQKFSSEGTAGTLAQLLTPVTMQIFSTPLHLHGVETTSPPSLPPAPHGGKGDPDEDGTQRCTP